MCSVPLEIRSVRDGQILARDNCVMTKNPPAKLLMELYAIRERFFVCVRWQNTSSLVHWPGTVISWWDMPWLCLWCQCCCSDNYEITAHERLW